MKVPFVNLHIERSGSTVRVLAKEFEEIKEDRGRLIRALEFAGEQLSQVMRRGRYAGNAYRKYADAVKAIAAKYNATAEWGVLLTGNIIDLRSAFVISNGVKIAPAEGTSFEDAKNEMDFCKAFFEFNKLDREMTQELAKESEIEGKIALRVGMKDVSEADPLFENFPKMVSVRFISWSETGYEVKPAADDYMDYESLSYTPQTGRAVSLKPDEFVYNKFGGRITDPNQAQPKIMKCLTQIDDVDKALRDWREINWLYSSPVFDIECEDQDGVELAKKHLDDLNKKIRRAFIHSGSKLDIKSPEMGGVDSLKEEVLIKIKIISGTTGIPVHFLGMIDLLKNKSTGDNVREMVIAATSKEREIWRGTYKELIEKAMEIYNLDTGKGKLSSRLDPSKITVQINVFSKEQWDYIERVVLPLYLADAISLKALLSRIPDIDTASELAEREKAEVSEKDALRAEVESLKAERDEANQRAGDGPVENLE